MQYHHMKVSQLLSDRALCASARRQRTDADANVDTTRGKVGPVAGLAKSARGLLHQVVVRVDVARCKKKKGQQKRA
jgi:hypothetical protein